MLAVLNVASICRNDTSGCFGLNGQSNRVLVDVRLSSGLIRNIFMFAHVLGEVVTGAMRGSTVLLCNTVTDYKFRHRTGDYDVRMQKSLGGYKTCPLPQLRKY